MIKREDVYKEIPSPLSVEKQLEPNWLSLIYRALYMNIRLSLDIRSNLVEISKGRKINQYKPKSTELNPVIKNTDVIK